MTTFSGGGLLQYPPTNTATTQPISTSPFQPVPTTSPMAPMPTASPTPTAAPAPTSAAPVYSGPQPVFTHNGSVTDYTGGLTPEQISQYWAAKNYVAPAATPGTSSNTATSSNATTYTSSPFAPLQQPLMQSGQQAITGGQTAYATGVDPQNALHDKEQQRLLDQIRVGEGARGITQSPYGQGVEQQGLSDFNMNWQNNLLNRQVTGLNALEGSIGTGQSLLGMGATNTTNSSGTNTMSPLQQQLLQAQVTGANIANQPKPSVTTETMAPSSYPVGSPFNPATPTAAGPNDLLAFPTGGTSGASPSPYQPNIASGGGFMDYSGTMAGSTAPSTSGGAVGPMGPMQTMPQGGTTSGAPASPADAIGSTTPMTEEEALALLSAYYD